MKIFIRKFAIAFILFLTIGFSFSCSDNNDKAEEPYFSLTTLEGNSAKTNLFAKIEGELFSFLVRSNSAWSISPSEGTAPWINISPNSGQGNGSFVITVAENKEFNSRAASFSCSADGQEFTKIKIEQYGLTPKMEVTPTSVAKFPETGGEVDFTINTNTLGWEYLISPEVDWIREVSKKETELTLSIVENPNPQERSAAITFTSLSTPEMKQSINIAQAAKTVLPVADLLDIVFKSDGSAEDISPLKQSVSTIEGPTLSTLFSNTYQRYIARFTHSLGSSTSEGYYKVDYSSNTAVRNGLLDGHTMETLFMVDESNLPNLEAKCFSSHEGGGTGFLIGNNSRGNSIYFLPHVGGGYIWTNSTVVPQKGKYYHVVGVWDKSLGKTSIYINGELKGSTSANGNFSFPSAGRNWFGIGGDPASETTAQTAWKGDVVIARIYDKALNEKEVSLLWNEVKDLTPSPDEIQLTDLSLYSKRVMIGSSYTIKGAGFEKGDKIKMTPLAGVGQEYTCEGTVSGNSLKIIIPENFATGKYRFNLVRGNKTLDLGFATLTVVTSLPEAPEIIAHRGYWTAGAPQNSVASLKKAQEIDIYGTEFDVWITTDGVVVLNHDPTINGVNIEKSSYEQLKNITLSNGEKIPTLADYLEQGKKDPSTKLILEIKTHSNSTNNNRVSTECVRMVKAANMTEQVEYIAFSLEVCKKVLAEQPDAIVAYLNGTETPEALHKLGIKGIDYNLSVLRSKPQWIDQAQELGMSVNVWTVNSEADLREMIDAGVDYITTDYPERAKQLIE